MGVVPDTNSDPQNSADATATAKGNVGQSASPTKPPEGFRRPRGHRAGLSIEKIVDAARSLPQTQLSMQAVANTLGVDRKALNHYVHDRENLLSIVAGIEFSEAFDELNVPQDADWRTVASAFARSTANGMLAAGLLSDYLQTGSNNAARFLDASEQLMRSMTEAGLDIDQAIRCSAVITNTCAAYTRDVVNARNAIAAQRHELLTESLEKEGEDAYPTLSQVPKSSARTTDDTQLDFAIERALDGIEVLIQKNKGK